LYASVKVLIYFVENILAIPKGFNKTALSTTFVVIVKTKNDVGFEKYRSGEDKNKC